MGGSKMFIDGVAMRDEPDREYARLYARFADLVRCGDSNVDLAPLVLVADAFAVAKRVATGPFKF